MLLRCTSLRTPLSQQIVAWWFLSELQPVVVWGVGEERDEVLSGQLWR